MFEKPFIQTTESRANNLDALRFLLACLVIHSHSFMLAGHEYHSLRQKLLHLQIGGGWLAVDFFFILSGFLVANSWLHSRGLADYLRRRVLRIYPGFVVCLLFCVLAVGPLGGANLATYFHDARTYAYFRPLILGPTGTLPGVFANAPWPNEVNVPLWTIRFEFLCYLLLAGIGLLGLLKHRRLMLGMFIVAMIAFALQVHGRPELSPIQIPLFGAIEQIPRFVAFFLAGTVFYLYREKIPQSGVLALAALAGLALGAKLHLFEPSLTLFGSYLIFYLGFNQQVRWHQFSRHGDFSYGMYLYGFPVQQLLVRHVPAASHPLLLTCMALCGALALSFLSWHLVERPFLKLKRSARAPHLDLHPSGAGAEPTLPTVATEQVVV